MNDRHLDRDADEDVLVLVEGESDAAVVRVLAAARGTTDVPILSSGGATGARRALARHM